MEKNIKYYLITGLVIISSLIFGITGITGFFKSETVGAGIMGIIITVLIIFKYFSWIKKCEREAFIKEEELKKESKMIEDGYQKIYNNFYTNEKEKKICLNDNFYGFSDIIESTIVKNSNTSTSTYGNSKGKIKNGKIKSKTNTYSNNIQYCKDLYINIVIDSISNPNEKIFIKRPQSVKLNEMSVRYKELYEDAERVQSVLQVIIKNGKENYIENGTVTKIEHRYITEEDAMSKIQKLSELHDAGVLTDYEFSIKKQELLDKVK